MKKILFTFLWLSSLVVVSYSQNFEWRKTFSENDFNYVHGVETDSSGNVYSIGEFIGTTDFVRIKLSVD